MKAVVTGAAGFVGHHLCNGLLADSRFEDVVGIDCLTDYYDTALKRSNLSLIHDDGRFRFVEADLSSADLGSVVGDADVVFHQAGQPGVRASWGATFGDYLTHNILATQRLLEYVASGGVEIRRFVYASSSSVYGNAIVYPTTELTLPAPVSPYGVTKLAAEHMCTLYARNFGVPTVSLRYFTVYGPRQRPDMLFARLVASLNGGAPVKIFGDGEQIRDFTHVDDIVRANIAAGLSDCAPGSVFNISGGTNVSVRDVIRILSGLTGRDVPVVFGDRVPGDAVRTGGDSTSASAALSWQPRIALEVGLESML